MPLKLLVVADKGGKGSGNLKLLVVADKGGKGSGNFGHGGRPGKLGGSTPMAAGGSGFAGWMHQSGVSKIPGATLEPVNESGTVFYAGNWRTNSKPVVDALSGSGYVRGGRQGVGRVVWDTWKKKGEPVIRLRSTNDGRLLVSFVGPDGDLLAGD